MGVIGTFGIVKAGGGGGGAGLYVRVDGTTPLTANWDAGAFTITADSFVSNLDSTISGLTIGKGGGSISTNSAVGYNSLFSNVSGANIVSLGYSSLQSNTTGTDNTGVGSNSLMFNTTGSQNTAIGSYALRLNTTGVQNTAIGYYSLRANTIADANTGIGYFSLQANTTGYYNTAIGWSSLKSNISGQENTAIGYNTLSANTTGYDNVAIGIGSLSNNTTSYQNTAIGSYTLISNTSGYNNVGIGFDSLYNNTTGITNTAIGAYSAEHNTIGTNNTNLGYASGRHISDGSTPNTGSINCVYLGANTKSSTTTDTNQIVIGYNAIGAGSNTVTIGNTSITDTYLRGYLTINGAYKLPNADGLSGQVLQTNGAGVISFTYLVPSVQSVVSSATVTPTYTDDEVVITAQATGLTLANPTGSWSQGQPLMIRILDNGVSRTITYDTKYRAIGVTLPTSTTAGKVTYLGILYNSTSDTFDVIGVNTQA